MEVRNVNKGSNAKFTAMSKKSVICLGKNTTIFIPFPSRTNTQKLDMCLMLQIWLCFFSQFFLINFCPCDIRNNLPLFNALLGNNCKVQTRLNERSNRLFTGCWDVCSKSTVAMVILVECELGQFHRPWLNIYFYNLGSSCCSATNLPTKV